MAEETSSGAPAISQGQTTQAGNNTHAVEGTALEGEAVQQAQPDIFGNWLLWAVAALWIWYLFGNKKRKAQRAEAKKENERRSTLQKGDMVITIGRMHGKVVGMSEKSVTIKPDNKSDYTMTFDREAIYRVLPRPGEEEDGAAAKDAGAEADSGAKQ